MGTLNNHNLVETNYKEILFEKRPCINTDGTPVKDLYNAWIILNNPKQFNSYTTAAVKEIILAFGEASNDRSVVAVVFASEFYEFSCAVCLICGNEKFLFILQYKEI